MRRKLEQASAGKLEFLRELGRGGMGIVYLARDVELQRLVAVKVLASSWLTDEAMIERFRREARTVASLRHPAIVHVHGVGRAEDLHYFVMDYIEGVSLSQILRLNGPLSLPAVQTILYQVGSALSYAHRPGRGVIHRDIKPGNIMVDVEGNPVVMDFGISKVSEGHAGLTMTGVIMGTPEYMSPEQCRGATVTQASDQYALGAVLYAMLAGSPPFTGPHYEVLVAHTTQTPPPILAARPDCPPALMHAMVRMLEKVPADRWPDIKDALVSAGIRPPMADDPGRDELAWLVRHVLDTQPAARSATPPDASRTPTWLRILELPESVELGDELDLDAILGFADGKQLPAGEQVSWASTNPGVATIDPTTGQLVAVGAGSSVITASAAGVSGSIAVAVRPPRVVAIAIEPDRLVIEPGESTQLSALPSSRNGKSLQRPVLWSSSDPRIATVNESGVIEAHGVGSVHVLAHCDGVGTSATVRVDPPRVATLTLVNVPESMMVGETSFLRAVARTRSGRPVEAKVTWSAEDAEAAQISSSGVLKALATGSARVTAACEGQRATATVAILPAAAATIALIEPPRSIQVDERVRLRATIHDRNGNPLDRPVAWMSGDPGILEIDAAGSVRGVRVGRAEVVATCDGLKAQAIIDVRTAPVASISVSPVPRQLLVGDTFNLVAEPLTRGGRPVERAVTWKVDDPGVLQTLGDGRFLVVGAGQAAVSATADEASATIRLFAETPSVRDLMLRNVPKSLEIGSRLRLQAEARDQRQRPLPRTINWMSSEPALARVSDDGLLEVTAPGWFEISAECDGVRASARIEALGTIVAPFPPPFSRREQEVLPAAAPEAHDIGGPAAGSRSSAGMNADRARLPLRVILGGLGAVTLALVAALIALSGDGEAPPASAAPPELLSDILLVDAAGQPIVDDIALVVGDTITLRASAVDSSGTALASVAPILSSRDPLVATVDKGGPLIALAPGTTDLVARANGLERAFPIRVEAPPLSAQARPGAGAVTAPPSSTQTREPQTPAAPAADGTLQLNIQPWAHVTIDGGRTIDEVQRRELRLAPGRHTLRLENPNTTTVDTSFVITSGAVTRMLIRMRPREP